MKLLLALALLSFGAGPKKAKLVNKVQGPYYGCTDAQRAAIDQAVPEAAKRVWKAKEKVSGLSPFGDERTIELRRANAKKMAKLLMKEEEPDTMILSAMYAYLGPHQLDARCADAKDAGCGARSAYVKRDQRRVVWLCPNFFSAADESRVRTMIHESAHTAGVGEADGESYCPVFTCDAGCGTKDTADAWSQWVHCVTDQPRDQPMEITADKPQKN